MSEKKSEKRYCIFLFILAISYTVWGTTFSLTAPFYPGEAENKGATPSQVITKETYENDSLTFNQKLLNSKKIMFLFLLKVWLCVWDQ